MHTCRISDVLSEEEQQYLGDLVEQGVEEARDVLKAHEDTPPPLFDVQSIGEAAQDYTNLITTAKARLAALERIKSLLETK